MFRKKSLTDIIFKEQEKIVGTEQAGEVASYLSFYVNKAVEQGLIEPENQLEYKRLFYDCFKVIQKGLINHKNFKECFLDMFIVRKYFSLDNSVKDDMDSNLNGNLSLSINSMIDSYLQKNSNKKRKARVPNCAWKFSAATLNILINPTYISIKHTRSELLSREKIKQMFT